MTVAVLLPEDEVPELELEPVLELELVSALFPLNADVEDEPVEAEVDDDDDDELLSSSIVIDISAYSEPTLMFELMVIYPAHSTLILCTPYSSGTLSVNSVISLST